ncbi:unnamed protein product, partial [Gongylonema pulchrum]|uniref:Uncharacterized protein n=1 Tax=Gongylonema pulchrum TaxID=637853 RepID=A0A183EWN3_9BILA
MFCSNEKEVAPTTLGETRGRDTCKDGLAGVDINNAGVIVIDDRPDGQMDDAAENNDDFEEVLSKKSKKLRQQQINEQLEAEERRKMKEKEKIERRKARMQAKRLEKKAAAASKDERGNPAGAMRSTGSAQDAVKIGPIGTGSTIGTKDIGQGIGRSVLASAQNTLNTTVWNSSILREQTMQPSPPVENHPVIPSPIARPTPKTNSSSTATSKVVTTVKKEIDLWTGPDEEQRLQVTEK